MLARHRGRGDWWRFYHKSVVQFVRVHYPEADALLTWVEIGTAFGATTDFVLSELPNVVAHAVDPCKAGYDWSDGTAHVLNRYRTQGNMTHGEFSDASVFTVRAPRSPIPPLAPVRDEFTDIGATTAGDASITVSWSAPDDNGAGQRRRFYESGQYTP